MRRIGLAVVLCVGLFAAPLITRAQPAGTPSRVGMLSGGSAVANPQIKALREGLQALGWVDGRNIAIEARFADGHMDRLASLAAELVRLDVHVIVAGPSTVAQAARQATRIRRRKRTPLDPTGFLFTQPDGRPGRSLPARGTTPAHGRVDTPLQGGAPALRPSRGRLAQRRRAAQGLRAVDGHGARVDDESRGRLVVTRVGVLAASGGVRRAAPQRSPSRETDRRP
jgi:hypothetical protein